VQGATAGQVHVSADQIRIARAALLTFNGIARVLSTDKIVGVADSAKGLEPGSSRSVSQPLRTVARRCDGWRIRLAEFRGTDSQRLHPAATIRRFGDYSPAAHDRIFRGGRDRIRWNRASSWTGERCRPHHLGKAGQRHASLERAVADRAPCHGGSAGRELPLTDEFDQPDFPAHGVRNWQVFFCDDQGDAHSSAERRPRYRSPQLRDVSERDEGPAR